MRNKATVLVIDDEKDALKMLHILLDGEGYDVVLANGAEPGLHSAYRTHPDVILLDVMMPGMDGFEVCRRLREMTAAPIIFVTAKGTIENIVQGFSAGGDDYIVKPYDFSELLCRLQVALRRGNDRDDITPDVLFSDNSVVLHLDRHELEINGRVVHLTPKEFEVLRLLIRHAGKVLSHDAILAQIWGFERMGDLDLIKQYIYRLRQKIEKDPESPTYIHTVWGEGYYFDLKNSGY
mgnify:CR=1 FL=1